MKVVQTAVFKRWYGQLLDTQAKRRIAVRLGRVEEGNFGDAKNVGAGVSELRIPYGPGYRLYFMRRGEEIVILLCGGDKDSQAADIQRAQTMAEMLKRRDDAGV
jgi:putative addiction module killer protein